VLYFYGKSEKRTVIVAGTARRKLRARQAGRHVGCDVRDHHEGYISWEEYERNQQQLALNDYGRSGGTNQAAATEHFCRGFNRLSKKGTRLSEFARTDFLNGEGLSRCRALAYRQCAMTASVIELSQRPDILVMTSGHASLSMIQQSSR